MKDPIKMVKECQKENIPFLVLKATDKLAFEVIQEYNAKVQEHCEIPEEFKKEIQYFADSWEAYKALNRTKVPD